MSSTDANIDADVGSAKRSLGPAGLLTEETSFWPNSPCAASKASADHLAHAYFTTCGLSTLIANCWNNYAISAPGTLILSMILNALQARRLLVYGDGGKHFQLAGRPGSLVAAADDVAERLAG